MEAEFAESEESFFSLALITKAVGENLSYIPFTENLQARTLYAGLDFGKHRDHSVISVVEYGRQAKTATLVHMRKFPLETDYSAVIGYAKRQSDNWRSISRITTDTTGVGRRGHRTNEKDGPNPDLGCNPHRTNQDRHCGKPSPHAGGG